MNNLSAGHGRVPPFNPVAHKPANQTPDPISDSSFLKKRVHQIHCSAVKPAGSRAPLFGELTNCLDSTLPALIAIIDLLAVPLRLESAFQAPAISEIAEIAE